MIECYQPNKDNLSSPPGFRGRGLVYISGKMTGVKDLNRFKFEQAEVLLRCNGYEVVNPHKILPYFPDLTWKDYMKADIKALMDCDMVAVLDDWMWSKGACVEIGLALDLDYPIISAHTLEPMTFCDKFKGQRLKEAIILSELEREYDMRVKVYAKQVEERKITKEEADRRKKVILQVMDDYKNRKTGYPLAPAVETGNLFQVTNTSGFDEKTGEIL